MTISAIALRERSPAADALLMRVRPRADNGLEMLEPPSPELALVDPILAAAARDKLHSYDAAVPDLFACLERMRAEEAVLPRPDHPVAAGAVAMPPSALPAPVEGRSGDAEAMVATVDSTEPRSWRPGRRTVARALALLAVAATVALGVRAIVHRHTSTVALPVSPLSPPLPRSSTGADALSPAATAPIPRVAGKTRDVRGSTRQTTRSRGAGSHRLLPLLAWRRAPHATFYRVQIFRSDHRGSPAGFLYEVWTSEPRLSPPRAWVTGGRHHSLGRGTYRWYVFPVYRGAFPGSGVGARRSIAQGKLVVTH